MSGGERRLALSIAADWYSSHLPLVFVGRLKRRYDLAESDLAKSASLPGRDSRDSPRIIHASRNPLREIYVVIMVTYVAHGSRAAHERIV